jgi:hypothetical protein
MNSGNGSYKKVRKQLLSYLLSEKLNIMVHKVTDPEVLVRFPVLPDFLRSSESGTGSAQPREYS